MPEEGGFPGWIRYAGLGLEMAGAIGGFSLVGYWIDRHFSTTPWGIVGGVILGLVGGLYNLVRQSLAAFREAKAADGRDAQAPRIRGDKP